MSSPPNEEPGMAGGGFAHARALASPSLSSSSHTPSSCNLDDVGSHDLSDVSSLDGSDFEIIEVVRRPASSLSARSREHTATEGAASGTYDAGLLGDQTDQWATVPRHRTLSDGSHAIATEENAGDLSTVLTEQDAAEADLLNRSLTSTFALSRHEQQDSGPSSGTASTCIITPIASVLENAAERRFGARANDDHDDGDENAFDASNATPSVLVSSQFTFPDPLSLSQAGDHARPQGEGRSRQQWTPIPSEIQIHTPSTAGHPSERGWNRARARAPPTATASSLGFNTFIEPTSLDDSTVEVVPWLAGTQQPPFPGRPTRKTHVDLPANVNVYYLGRRADAAVMWRISQAIKTSLGEAIGLPLQHLSREAHDGAVVVSRSAAGNAFGKRILHLKEIDCTEAHDELPEQSATTESYLRGPAADDVAKGNALIVCCLEGRRPCGPSSSPHLARRLAGLLELIHVGLSSITRSAGGQTAEVPKPLILPVLCPRSTINAVNTTASLNDATSTESSGQPRELMRQLSTRIDVQAVDKEWSSTLAETLRLLKAYCAAPHLHVQFAPGTAFVRVIGFEALVSCSASWFRGDTAWACRAAMPLTTTANSPLVLLQAAAASSKQAQTPPAWLIKTHKWLSRGVQATSASHSYLETRGGSGEEKQLLGRAADAAGVKDGHRCDDNDDDDLERLSSRALSRHRTLRMVLLIVSLFSCVALLGSGTAPVARLFDQRSLSRLPLSASTSVASSATLPPSAASSTAAAAASASPISYVSYYSKIRNASGRAENCAVVASGSSTSSYASVSAASSNRSTGTAARCGKTMPSRTAELRANAIASKAVAIRDAVNQSTGLSVYRQLVFGEPAGPGPSRADYFDAGISCSERTGRARDGAHGCRSSSMRPSSTTTRGVMHDRLLELLLGGARQGASALIEGARLSWQYWLSELWRVYRDLVLPAQLYCSDASEQALRMLRIAQTASQAFADRQKREARLLLTDAVRGAVIVDDVLRARARGTRQWASTIFRDMTKGASIVSDAASSQLSSAADELKLTGKSFAQHWKTKGFEDVRQRALEARSLTDKLWGSALRRADEQLEYWFVADEC